MDVTYHADNGCYIVEKLVVGLCVQNI